MNESIFSVFLLNEKNIEEKEVLSQRIGIMLIEYLKSYFKSGIRDHLGENQQKNTQINGFKKLVEYLSNTFSALIKGF